MACNPCQCAVRLALPTDPARQKTTGDFPLTLEKIRVSHDRRICFISRVTFASKITITRISLVPVFAFLACYYGYTVNSGQRVEALRWWALGVFVAAAATDGLDGWIARKFNQCSEFGAFIDPIADKALLLTGVITLTFVNWGKAGWRLPLWFAVIVVLRDCIILGGIKVLYCHHRGVKIVPHWTGKVCTVTQMFALGWVMLRVIPLSPVYPCIPAAIFTLWSSVTYIRQGQRILRGT